MIGQVEEAWLNEENVLVKQVDRGNRDWMREIGKFHGSIAF